MTQNWDTPKLGSHELVVDQLLSEVDINDNTWLAELFGEQVVLKSRTTVDPPVSPANGDVYFLPTGSTPTGVWVAETPPRLIGYKNGWAYCATPKDGFLAWIEDERVLARYDSATDDWLAITGPHDAGLEVRVDDRAALAGAPLYRKRIAFGALPNTAGGSTSVAHGISGLVVAAGAYLKVDAWMSDGTKVRPIPYVPAVGSGTVDVEVSATQVTIRTSAAGLGGWSAVVELTYEKV